MKMVKTLVVFFVNGLIDDGFKGLISQFSFRFLVISRQMFNPNYALFQQSPTDKVTYRINPLSSINSNHKL